MGISSNSKIKVAVLRGGPSQDYDASLKTGEYVLYLLREKLENYEPIDIFISKDGEWHLKGVRVEPHKALEYADMVFNALHGKYADEGGVQKMLTAMNKPYTGSSALGSVMALNKDLAKSAYLNHGLFTPRHEMVTSEDELDRLVEIFRNYMHPLVIKPNTENSRRGIKLAYTFEELAKYIDEALEYSPKVMVEEFIRGREARCGVIEGFRGEKYYALVPVEVVTPRRNKSLPDYDLKFNSVHDYLDKSTFTPRENKVLEHVAKMAHEALGLRHYSCTDLIMTPQGKVYVLETGTSPDLSKNSLFHKSLESLGASPERFLEHILILARESK
ncbi:MAG: hypothetical protein WAV25_02615 [Minisyncoccia bacterium]